MNEAAVSKKLRESFVSLGAVSWKISDRFHASRPDVFFAFRAECGFIEMKMWPAVPTSLQKDTLNELSAVGMRTYLGQYDKKLKTFKVTDWVTNEVNYFDSAREVATWLLEQLS